MRSQGNDWLDNLFFELLLLPLAKLLLLACNLSYAMAFVRWLLIDHTSFWHGFKELLWVLCPVLNIAYVWDWWLTILRIGWSLVQYVIHLVTQTITWAEIELKNPSSWIALFVVFLTIAGFLIAEARIERQKRQNKNKDETRLDDVLDS